MHQQCFRAENSHKAFMMVHKTLGPDALIFSTSQTPSGVEVIAGFAENDVVMHQAIKKTVPKFKPLLDKIKLKTTPLGIKESLPQILKNLNHKPIVHKAKLDDLLNVPLLQNKKQKKYYEKPLIEKSVVKTAVEKRKAKNIFETIQCDNIQENQISKLVSWHCSTHQNWGKVLALQGSLTPFKLNFFLQFCLEIKKNTDLVFLTIITNKTEHVGKIAQFLGSKQITDVSVIYSKNKRAIKKSLLMLQHKRLVLIDTDKVEMKLPTINFEKVLYKLNDFYNLLHSVIYTFCNVQSPLFATPYGDFQTCDLKGWCVGESNAVLIPDKMNKPLAQEKTLAQHFKEHEEAVPTFVTSPAIETEIQSVVQESEQMIQALKATVSLKGKRLKRRCAANSMF